MIFNEKKMNLFCLDKTYALAHCISADYELGAGIAVDFQKKFHLKSTLKQIGSGSYPECIYVNQVFNLVTKAKYWNKPTYTSLVYCLDEMRALASENGISKIAMPRIGCGLDRLSWPKVREIIKGTFQYTDIEILVCNL